MDKERVLEIAQQHFTCDLQGTEILAFAAAIERELMEGMVLVPREPDQAQIEEGEMLLRCMIEAKTSLDVRLVYSAMIAAATSGKGE